QREAHAPGGGRAPAFVESHPPIMYRQTGPWDIRWPMKRVLFVTTNVATIPGTDAPTGVWLSGVAHPYYHLVQAGYEVHIASPLGGRVPIDPFSHPASERSIARDDIITQGFLAAPHHGGRLLETAPLASIDPREYRAMLICGGNGAMFDLPGN